MDRQQLLKMLAPYFAVVLFWLGLSNGWLAILAYHAQIVFWAIVLPGIRDRKGVNHLINHLVNHLISGLAASATKPSTLLLALPALCAGPLLYFLLPHITSMDLSAWLAAHRLSPLALLIMVPYFGIVHPFLEQAHWAPLRETTAFSHLLFAGYHLLVLYSLLSLPWLIACFLLLTAASALWAYMTKQTHGIFVPYLSHALADTGIIMAAWIQVSFTQ